VTPTPDKLAAARGLANLPPEAALELLVALARDEDAAVRAQARHTLESWSSDKLQPALARRSASAEVLEYFLAPDNLRRDLLPAILKNRNTPQEPLAELAAGADLETVKLLLDNIDALRTPALVSLKNNSTYRGMHTSRLAALEEGFVFEPSFLELLIAEAQLEDERQQLQRLDEEEEAKLDAEIAQAEASGNEEKKHESMYSKIARMNVSQKVQLALKGTKDERALLVRDSSKVVSRAVLGSPKVTEAEIETFAALKSVSDEVLRMIAMSRKFMKSYNVVRNLVSNPRTPLEVGLPLLNRLLPQDVRGIAMNKNVPDVLRKMAEKSAKQKKK
jgi:hypothetical protein